MKTILLRLFLVSGGVASIVIFTWLILILIYAPLPFTTPDPYTERDEFPQPGYQGSREE